MYMMLWSVIETRNASVITGCPLWKKEVTATLGHIT